MVRGQQQRACLTPGVAASLRGTRPAWRACLTPGAAASLRCTKPARRACLTPFFLNFEFDVSYYMCACDDYHTLLMYIHTYIHALSFIHTSLYSVYMHHHHPSSYIHTYIHTYISPLYTSITHLNASYMHTYIHTSVINSAA